MDPVTICKIFWGICTAAGIGGTLIPSLKKQVLNYGSRSSTPKTESSANSQGNLERLLKYIASVQVPHIWFTHFYILSVASSIFWAFQIYTHGRAFQFLASGSPHTSAPSMSVNQVFLAWLLMAIQGTRRLYECIIFTNPSQSKMWFGLWLLGIVYYIFMGISVWIEGIGE